METEFLFVDKVGLKLRDLPAASSQGIGLKLLVSPHLALRILLNNKSKIFLFNKHSINLQQFQHMIINDENDGEGKMIFMQLPELGLNSFWRHIHTLSKLNSLFNIKNTLEFSFYLEFSYPKVFTCLIIW